MTVVPLNLPWEPDKGPMSQSSLDQCINALPLPEGWGPISNLMPYSQSLGSECKGAWWFRDDNGVFNTVAATQSALWKLGSAALNWVEISGFGADTATNGSFATDTGWTKGTGVTIAGGVGVFTSVANGQILGQAQTLVPGAQYRVTFTILNYSAGGVRPIFGGGTQVDGTTRNANGTYTQMLTAVTGNTTLNFQAQGTTTLQIDNVIIQRLGGYIGPADGELWTATIFGPNFYVSNINDPLQVIAMSSLTNFTDAPGNPPQAKIVTTIGDFLFLAHTKTGVTVFPRYWQHSKINDPTNWVIDGSPGASDGQTIADGDDIMAVLPMAGASARIIQKRARKALLFSPGSATAFSQIDIDATRGAIAGHSCVSLGSTNYFFLSDNGFILNDDYTPIGSERVDTWFFAQVDKTRLYAVKAAVDATKKIVWVTFEDQTRVKRIIGYNWFLDRWFQSDQSVDLFVTTVSPGYVLDDLTGVLDDYPNPPLDSPFWGGGVLNFGAFKADGKMHLFAGQKANATIETPTMELAENRGAYVWGASLIGNLQSYTIAHGTAFTPDQNLTWSPQRERSRITGICPFSKDGKWHRFRVITGEGGTGTHIHGIRPHARPSTLA